jgi:hypothetical protein
MLIGKYSGVAFSLATLALIGGAAASAGQTVPAEQPRPETLAKLIAQLNAADFRSRQQASEELEKLGAPILPALRKAAPAATALETKRRIENVVNRIENALLKTEEKRWEDLDAPKRGIKDRLGKILAKTPELSDQQIAMAIYLLTVGRAPTDDEVRRAKKQFAENDGRPASILQLTRSLVQGKEFNAKVAAANGHVLKVRHDIVGETELADKLRRLNGAEFQKFTGDISASLDKAVKSDAQLIDLTFLLVVSRFPTSAESKAGRDHLKRAAERPTAIADLFWALMNTKEFCLAP